MVKPVVINKWLLKKESRQTAQRRCKHLHGVLKPPIDIANVRLPLQETWHSPASPAEDRDQPYFSKTCDWRPRCGGVAPTSPVSDKMELSTDPLWKIRARQEFSFLALRNSIHTCSVPGYQTLIWMDSMNQEEASAISREQKKKLRGSFGSRVPRILSIKKSRLIGIRILLGAIPAIQLFIFCLSIIFFYWPIHEQDKKRGMHIQKYRCTARQCL